MVQGKTRLYFVLMFAVLLFAFWLRIEDLNHYPVGINNDEATNLIDSHFFRVNGKFPFFTFDLSPRGEPIFRFVQGTAAYFGGASPFVARYTGVLAGILGIAVAFWASQESLRLLFPQSKAEWRKLAAIVAACFLTLAIGHLTLSRTPYRTMYQILFSLCLTGFLARGLRLWQWRDFILSGIFLGILPYTYTSAFLLPFALIPLGIVALLRDVSAWRKTLRRLLVLGLISAVLVLPIPMRLLDATNFRLRRLDDVGAQRALSLETLSRQLVELFFVDGYPRPEYNVAHAPVIPPLFAPFVLLGIALIIWRWRHPFTGYLVAAFCLALVPLLLANEVKHGLRVSGEYGFLPFIVAIGAYAMLWLVFRLMRHPAVLRGLVFVIMTSLVLGGLQARQVYRDYWDYPENWTIWRAFNLELTHNEWFYRADRRYFAEWLISLNRPILIPADEISEIPTRVWLLNEFPNVVTTERFTRLPADTQFVMPYTIGLEALRTASLDYVLLMDGRVYLLPPIDAPSHAALLAQLEGAEALYREGEIEFLGYVTPLPENFSLAYQTPNTVFPANFNEQLAVINWRGVDTLPRHEATSLSISTEWTGLDSMWAWYWLSVQLQTQDRVFIAGQDNQVLRWLYPTALWQLGDTVPYRSTLDIPPLETGAYRLTAGVYAIPNRELPADTDLSGNPTIGWIKVPPETMPSIPESAQAIEAVFADSVALSALEVLPQANEQILLRFYWTSLVQRPAFDAFVFVHLYREDGTIVAQTDARPQDGNYPSLIWDEGEIVMTEYLLDAAGQDLADLYLRTGMYIFPDGVNLQRLSLTMNGDAIADDILVLGRVADLIGE